MPPTVRRAVELGRFTPVVFGRESSGATRDPLQLPRAYIVIRCTHEGVSGGRIALRQQGIHAWPPPVSRHRRMILPLMMRRREFIAGAAAVTLATRASTTAAQAQDQQPFSRS